ncbi:hypothetical protein Tco_0667499 [Tanacetum coccineum]
MIRCSPSSRVLPRVGCSWGGKWILWTPFEEGEIRDDSSLYNEMGVLKDCMEKNLKMMLLFVLKKDSNIALHLHPDSDKRWSYRDPTMKIYTGLFLLTRQTTFRGKINFLALFKILEVINDNVKEHVFSVMPLSNKQRDSPVRRYLV